MNIAIDGPSGAGKSSLAKAIAKHYGMIYVDTGALYRSIGLYACRCGIAVEEIEKIIAHLPEINLSLGYVEGEQHVYLNDEDVSNLIRTAEIAMYASAVSAIPDVRAFLLDTQRDMAKKYSVIMDGRDIGTVILPNADVKIFLSADSKDRAIRRTAELLEKGQNANYEQVLKELNERDANDRNRTVAPAVPAEDAIHLDNSGLEREETFAKAIEIIENVLKTKQ